MTKFQQRIVIAVGLVLVAGLAWACIPMGSSETTSSTSTTTEQTAEDRYVAYARSGPMLEDYRALELIDAGYEYCSMMVEVEHMVLSSEDVPDAALMVLQRRSYSRKDLAENAWLLDAAVIHLCPEWDVWRDTR